MSQKSKSAVLIPNKNIESRIYRIRDNRVMLDVDLARLYDVETRTLVQAVKRHPERFPEDFMFQLDRSEYESLRSQIVISNAGRGGRRYLPYAFTEHGILMLSSVLNSERAIAVNIQIMRTYINFRELAMSHQDILRQIKSLERKYDSQFQVVFKAIKLLIDKDSSDPKRRF